MLDFISSFGFGAGQWALLLAASALIGINKTGIAGISLLAVPVYASVFGGIASTGIIVPILIIADIIAVISYRKSICWREFAAILPWTLAGFGIGLYLGEAVSDRVFKILISSVLILVLCFMLYREFKKADEAPVNRWYLNAVIGLLGGFSTIVGNVAGPIFAVYFLSRNLNKMEFIATRAWFFWLLNIFKLPFHIFIWKTITPETFGFDLLMLPVIVAGGFIGLWLVRLIPEKPYRIFIIAATFVSSLFLII